MSSQQQTPQDDVRECANGCGFYGTSQTNYMCSKCFKDAQGATIASIEATPAPAPAPPAPPANPPSLSTTTTAGPSALPSLAREPSMDAFSASASVIPSAPSVSAGAVAEAQAVVEGAAAAAEAAAPATAAAPVQKKRNRCATCNKKVGLTGIECRCELVFCGLHRYPEAHDCTFDFKAHDRENLKQTVMGGGEFAKIDRL